MFFHIFELMKNILIFGAGRSATSMIDYLLNCASLENWRLTIADFDENLAKSKVGHSPIASGIKCDINDINEREHLIQSSDFVISLLPYTLHILVAKTCLKFKKDLATASYLSEEMKALNDSVEAEGLLFMNELGLDPGIDHMSALKMIQEVKDRGGRITGFTSSTGGLVSPESDDNPWHYKISWNPRNVVLAGKGTSQYIDDAKVRFLPYHQLFKNYKLLNLKDYGTYEMYYNRDSVKYETLYGIQGVDKMIRGTIRHLGFCDAWAVLVALGLTDSDTILTGLSSLSYRQFFEGFLKGSDLELQQLLYESTGLIINPQIIHQLEYLGLLSDLKIPLEKGAPSDILEILMVEKLALNDNDKDLVVMHHELEYTLDHKNHVKLATLYHKGHDSKHTAMSELVGLPLAIFTKNRLKGKVQGTGVKIPVEPDIYVPILNELASLGILFEESDIS